MHLKPRQSNQVFFFFYYYTSTLLLLYMIATSYLTSNIHHMYLTQVLEKLCGWGRGGGGQVLNENSPWMGFAYMLYMYVCNTILDWPVYNFVYHTFMVVQLIMTLRVCVSKLL